MFSTFSSMSSIFISGPTALLITACPDPSTNDLVWMKFNPDNGVDISSGSIKNFTNNATLTNALINKPVLNVSSSGTGQNSDYGSVTLGTAPNRYIVVPLGINMAISRATGFTISCWVNIPSAAFTSSHNACIFSLPTSYGQFNNAFPYSIMKSGSNCYVSCLGNTQILYPSSKFFDNNWHLHTVTINEGSPNNIAFFLDGVQLGTSTGGSTTLQNYGTSNGNCFGFLSWGGTGIWTIPALKYADLRIYKSRLPDDQIRGLFRDTQNNHP